MQIDPADRRKEQALVFAAGSARYALRLAQIEQVLGVRPMRALAHAPLGILGLLTWREQLLPLVDLSLLSTRIPCVHRVGTRILIVRAPWGAHQAQREAASPHFALLAERVFDVIALSFRVPAFDVAAERYLGGFVDAEGQPQLLIPDALRDLCLSNGASMAHDAANDASDVAIGVGR